jgi:hypothetical protein
VGDGRRLENFQTEGISAIALRGKWSSRSQQNFISSGNFKGRNVNRVGSIWYNMK